MLVKWHILSLEMVKWLSLRCYQTPNIYKHPQWTILMENSFVFPQMICFHHWTMQNLLLKIHKGCIWNPFICLSKVFLRCQSLYYLNTLTEQLDFTKYKEIPKEFKMKTPYPATESPSQCWEMLPHNSSEDMPLAKCGHKQQTLHPVCRAQKLMRTHLLPQPTALNSFWNHGYYSFWTMLWLT